MSPYEQLARAYRRGKAAGLRNDPRRECPYPASKKRTEQRCRDEWIRGHIAGTAERIMSKKPKCEDYDDLFYDERDDD